MQKKSRSVGLLAVLLVAMAAVITIFGSTPTLPIAQAAGTPPNFGANVIIFDPTMPLSQISRR